jgi:adenylate cyclase
MDRSDVTDALLLEGRFRLEHRGLFRLDQAGKSEPVALGSRALDLLRLLVERQGELLAKDLIMETVWPGAPVEESNLSVQISGLRRILDHESRQGSCIQTIPNRGYRFVAPVRRSGLEGSDRPTLPLPDKPSIAVLPFQNLSGDPDQEYFVDGMVEEITTTLCRIRWLFVIARNSSFTYKTRPVDVREVGRELGVRYVLEGSVRRAGSRVRIAAQLIDAITGAHLWADRFDGALDDVFALQDRVASSVAGVIEPTLQAAETARRAYYPTTDLNAYDLYLRAYAMVWSSAARIPEALGVMEEAIARDPRYGTALAFAALCCHRLVIDGRSDDPPADRLKGVDFARRSLDVGGDDPEVLSYAALVLASFGEDIDAMTALVDRALALNPNYARGWGTSALLRLWADQLDLAVEHVHMALRLSPLAKVCPASLILGGAHFFGRRFDAALPELLRGIQDDPGFPIAYRLLASCYAHLGRLDDAREIVRRLRTITPAVISDAGLPRNPEHRELLLSGLRRAAADTN